MQGTQQNPPTPGNVQRGGVRTDGEERGGRGSNEEGESVGRTNDTSAADQGLSEIVVTTPFTPIRQGGAVPKRNIASELNGRRQVDNGEQITTSGNRVGRMEGGGN